MINFSMRVPFPVSTEGPVLRRELIRTEVLMSIRTLVLLFGSMSVVVACGGGERAGLGGNGRTDGGGGNDGATMIDGGGSDEDSGMGRDGGPGSPCTPKTCSELGKNCGAAADGCGGIVECGECSGDEVCSLTTPNVCGNPANLCERMSQTEACEGKACGFESDGCDGVVDCGSCPDGQTCVNFECTAGGDGECSARVPSCASVGAECGVIGDGCGGVIDCNTETGGCASGTYCGILAASRCDAPPPCEPTATSCAALGWQCGTALDNCGNQYSCAAEGRSCNPLETCIGGIDAPTQCVSAIMDCPLCAHVPNCQGAPQSTRITGRVVTPGRDDDDVGNQVGVPNAYVYVLRNNDVATLPSIETGLPEDGTTPRCDRCEDNVLGPVLTGGVSDARGEYVLEGNVPVGVEFLLVVKVGKFRRAVRMTIPANDACETTDLPTTVAAGNPTRLPRDLDDGLAVNIPHVAISTGSADAMECVLEKMGLAHAVFTRPSLGGRIHLYRDNGVFPDAQSASCSACSGSTCRATHCGGPNASHRTAFLAAFNAERLWEDGGRIGEYDFVISDCRGDASGPPSSGSEGAANIRRYVNRGGRMFASHFSHNWISDGSLPYDPMSPLETGLAPAVTWQAHDSGISNGTGIISQNPPRTSTSPRIQTFIDWMVKEGAVPSANDLTFNIPEPRSRATTLGPYTEEFVHCNGGVCDRSSRRRPQQVAFYTPYAAPEENAACGRVVYTGFHVSASGTSNQAFPDHCSGSLTPTEKTLMYLLFDLGACVGSEPTPPTCTPETVCGPGLCGTQPDGCGGSLDCGPCVPTCSPLTCESENAECGIIGDGCGGTASCGSCPSGQVCGAQAPNRCGVGMCMPRGCPAGAQCGQTGNGCGGVVQCGTCPSGQVCGIETPFVCGTAPGCTPVTCESVGAECGPIPDGCGGVRQCGTCPTGSLCGTQQVNRCSPIVI